ncbi:DUF1488 domain-containing protein [Emcibacter sp. SYSU 3D8]|uniref:DUF1488 domain-containing protein n=1 Tax=Emcibacter sp. SYSU 3D8 TaxID=3133969 RepID=UPI0031FE7CDD
MALSFPNSSRFHDPARHCVRFLGHDDMREVSFGVSEDALARIAPRNQRGEEGYLDAFDFNREQIHLVAVRLYRRGSKVWYTLNVSDF